MVNGVFEILFFVNELIFDYVFGLFEKVVFKSCIEMMLGEQVEILLIIGGKEVWIGKMWLVVCLYDYGYVFGIVYMVGVEEVQVVVDVLVVVWYDWFEMFFEVCVGVFLKVVDMFVGFWCLMFNVVMIFNQLKMVFQVEIDLVCELIDFLCFNVYFVQQIYCDQFELLCGVWNCVEYCVFEGFVFVVMFFNFIVIVGNLLMLLVLMGNIVFWKLVLSVLFLGYYVMCLL